MLTKKELSEYWTQEVVEHKKFENDLLKPKKRLGLKYPPENRFPKINYPTAIISIVDIWPQIPLFGTVFINLPPWNQSQLIEIGHWGTDTDIRNLIELSRLGKVYFILTGNPLDYEKLTYLHPILEELRPPAVMGNLAVDWSNPQDQLFYDEFMDEANKFFVSQMKLIYSHVSERHAKKRIEDYATDYVIMKKIGYFEIAEEMLNNLNSNPDIASAYFNIFGNLIATKIGNPMVTSYNTIASENFATYEDYLGFLKNKHKKTIKPDFENITIPGEIGHFLMEKLIPLSPNYQSAISMMTRFEQSDLHELMNSINMGYKQSRVNILQTKINELSEEFDNIWKDASKIKKKEIGIKYGFTMSLMALGGLVPLPIEGIGALAGIGFSVADKYLPSTSSKIANFFSPNYMVTINNFQKVNNIRI